MVLPVLAVEPELELLDEVAPLPVAELLFCAEPAFVAVVVTGGGSSTRPQSVVLVIGST